MIEHKFMFRTLELFGFGENFINLVKLIYKDTNSTVILPHGMSPRSQLTKESNKVAPSLPCSLLLQRNFEF